MKHKLSLRHWAFLSVNDKKNAVGHIESTFNLTGEVSVARGIDNVDFVIVIEDRSLFCGNCNSPLMFLVHGIHNKRLRHFRLIIAKGVGLFQETINKRGLTMVNVSDNRNISNSVFIHKCIF